MAADVVNAHRAGVYGVQRPCFLGCRRYVRALQRPVTTLNSKIKHSLAKPLLCVTPTQGPATSTSSAASSSEDEAGSSTTAPLPRGPDDPPNLDSLVRQLDQLLATAGAGEGQQARRAEAAAVAAATRGRELGLLRGFGGARQVPKRLYTIEELRLNRVETEKLLSPKDNSLNAVRTQAQVAGAAGLAAAAWANHWDGGNVLAALFGVVFVLVADQVANGGGGEALAVDTVGRLLRPSYAARVAYHEAGHMLVAYLVGLLPRAYTLSSLDAFLRYRALNIQAGTRFCDSEFAAEVATGRLKSSSLDRYTCVALAGVVTEYLRFDVAEGGLGDVQQLDGMFRALQFTQKKADGEVRWAVLNCASILRRHARLHDELAEAMRKGKTVGECIELIETRLKDCSDV